MERMRGTFSTRTGLSSNGELRPRLESADHLVRGGPGASALGPLLGGCTTLNPIAKLLQTGKQTKLLRLQVFRVGDEPQVDVDEPAFLIAMEQELKVVSLQRDRRPRK